MPTDHDQFGLIPSPNTFNEATSYLPFTLTQSPLKLERRAGVLFSNLPRSSNPRPLTRPSHRPPYSPYSFHPSPTLHRSIRLLILAMSTMKIYALVRGRALVGGYERYLLQIRSDRSELPSILTVWMDLPEGTNLTEGALYYVRGDCFFDDRGRIFMRVPHTFLVNRTIIPIPLTLFKKVVGPLFNLLGLCRNFIQTEPFSFVMELCVGPSFNATITYVEVDRLDFTITYSHLLESMCREQRLLFVKH